MQLTQSGLWYVGHQAFEKYVPAVVSLEKKYVFQHLYLILTND